MAHVSPARASSGVGSTVGCIDVEESRMGGGLGSGAFAPRFREFLGLALSGHLEIFGI